MKFLLTICFLLITLNAANVEVVANKFYADEAKQTSIFTGDVVVTKEQDRLSADQVTIHFDKKKQPLEYIAQGHAKVDMLMNEKKYFASADTMVYDPIKNEYELIGNAFLHEITTDKKVYGDKIFVNQLSGRYEVDSKGDKPVKFIFKVEDKKK